MAGSIVGLTGAVGGAAAKGATSIVVKNFMEKVVGPYFSGRAAKTQMMAHLKSYLRWLDQRTKYVPTIAIQGGVFPIDEIYEPLEICSIDGLHQLEVSEYPSAAFDKNRCIAIVDSAGMGKSTLTKFILRSSLNGLRKIPVLVELRRLKSNGTIIELICADIVKAGSGAPVAGHLLSAMKDGNFIFFLDGYDEIQDEIKSSVSQEIVKITSDFPLCNFMLTSRKEAALSGFPEFFWYGIARLSPEKSLSLLRRYDRNKGVADRLWSKAARLKEISDFLQIPLLLTLLYKAFDYKSVIPLKKTTFFRQVFDALYQDHDLSKEGFFERRKKSSLDLDDFHKVLRRVGLESVKRGEVQFSPEEFHELVARAINNAGLDVDPSRLKADLVSAVPLFVRDGSDYRWSHKSFADYFAAKCIWMDLGKEREDVVSAMFDSERCEKYVAVFQLASELDEGLVFDGRICGFLAELVQMLPPEPVESDLYLAAVDFVAKIYLIPGEFSMEDPQVFEELHEKVGLSQDLEGYRPWRITWLKGRVLFVERNKRFAQLSVIGELIGKADLHRPRRLSTDFYPELDRVIYLNEYVRSAEPEGRDDAMSFIHHGMKGVRVPSLPAIKGIIQAAERRRRKSVVIGDEW